MVNIDEMSIDQVRQQASEKHEPDGKPKVLAIDDEPGALQSITVVLKDRCDVVTSTSKVEALKRLHEIRPDVVITDLYSPDLSGFTFIESLKKLAPSIPVIVISGNIHPTVDMNGEKAKRASQLGAVACMPKPFDVAELRRTVDRVLETRRGNAS